MGSRRHTHNKDYFNIRGSTPGPAGPLKQFKDALTQERAVLRRDEEHKLPGESPQAGKRKTEGRAHRAERHSVLDDLPKPVGAAGVPRSAKMIPTAEEEDHETEHQHERRGGEARRDFADASYEYEEDGAGGYVPRGYRTGEPFEQEQESAGGWQARDEEAEELSPVTRRIVRTLPFAFRAVGEAARAIDRPVKRVLHRLQSLGEAARKQ